MKHKTLRCTAETAALLLTVAMLAFLIAGLHQHDPDRAFAAPSTGWVSLTDGVQRDVRSRPRSRLSRGRRSPCITTR
ncbi:MAG: hypothetical protein ACLS69_04335 [Butyricicoccus sp.]